MQSVRMASKAYGVLKSQPSGVYKDADIAFQERRKTLQVLRNKVFLNCRYTGRIVADPESIMDPRLPSESPSIFESNLCDTDNAELIGLLKHYLLASSSRGRNLAKFEQIRREAHRRTTHRLFTLRDMLLLADIHYCLLHTSHGKLGKRYLDLMAVVIDLNFHMYEFHAQDIAQLLYYMTVAGKPQLCLIRHLETLILQRLDDFTGNEIGLICFAYFATNTSIRQYELVYKLAHKGLQEAKSGKMDRGFLTNIFRILRHSHVQDQELFQGLGWLLMEDNAGREPPLKAERLIDFASSCAACRITHQPFFLSLANTVSNCLTHWNDERRFRIKDLIKMVNAYQCLQSEVPATVLSVLHQQLEEEVNFLRKMHPEALLDGVLALAMSGIFSHKCINCVLSDDFVGKQLGKDRDLPVNEMSAYILLLPFF